MQNYSIDFASPDDLVQYLVSNNDKYNKKYVDDFLLTYRVFFPYAQWLMECILNWLKNPSTRSQAFKILLQWIFTYFSTDFLTDSGMTDLLEKAEEIMDHQKMEKELVHLNLSIFSNAVNRNIIINRSEREENLYFSIQGGCERKFGIFVSHVEKGSKIDQAGLRRGDQILDVNGQNFASVTYLEAYEMIRKSTHLSLTVKFNWLDFREVIKTPVHCRKQSSIPLQNNNNNNDNPSFRSLPRPKKKDKMDIENESSFGNRTDKIRKAFRYSMDTNSVDLFQRKKLIELKFDESDGEAILEIYCGEECTQIKVDSKTTAEQAVKKALISFKIRISPHNFSLYEVSEISGGIMKRRRLPNDHCSLVQRLPKGGRYYLKNNACVSNGLPKDFEQVKGISNSMKNLEISEYPEQVLRIYFGDQYKYVLVSHQTTVREAIQLAIEEFDFSNSSKESFSLYEISSDIKGMLKQRRLPENLSYLSDNLSLSGRYYLKNNSCTRPLVDDKIIIELQAKAQISFFDLEPFDLAIQLTLRDFEIFRQIHPTEYIKDIFQIASAYGTPMLTRFEELSQTEALWVATEICSESNIVTRSKIIKNFIKLVAHCLEFRNFNSVFAILGGLNHGAVQRLRQTWEKVPTKHRSKLKELEKVTDPTRNMQYYRNLISKSKSPLIPSFPMIKKDLTFIHVSNKTRIKGKINFYKLREVSKIIHQLKAMVQSSYDQENMVEKKPKSFTMTTRRRSSMAFNKTRKMYEDALSIKRIKTYLSNFKVITNEDKLYAMSLEHEPSNSATSIYRISMTE
ncbi:RAPGEF2 [Cordylochernes scorpioides]|uniref:RAPGEF2 n=1 Tax=Cordylochernes scorpioides TaxID=51811 RepID=A0ABY6LTQ3_9ARAC|nr:RAPGEF2 [Cordylochernes scorpioides]